MKSHMEHIADAMAEALRLTRAGKIPEATGLIQRTLKGEPSQGGASADYPGTREPAEAPKAQYRPIEEQPSPHEASDGRKVLGNAAQAIKHLAGKFLGGWKSREITQATQEHTVTPEEPIDSTRARGRFINGSYTNEAGTLAYKLYVPSSYEGQPLPLLVMLHGCTQSPADFAAGTRMNELAEKQQFLVVYPEQSQRANASKCWNWFETPHQQRGRGEPSLIAGITRKVMSTYRISARRVYVVGMSAGGAMAAIMAATYPEIYAAVGVHSGLPYGAANDLASGFKAMHKGSSRHRRKLESVIPLILFHGDHDTTVAKINSDHMREQWLQAFGNHGRIAGSPTVERGMLGGHAYTRLTYHDTDGQLILEEWIIHHGGHAWSGGSSQGSFTDPKGPDASAEIVRFLQKHSRGN